MNSGYLISGSDMLATYNIRVKKIDGLYPLLNRKGDLGQSWPDSDGEEPYTDTSDIYFEGHDVIMFAYIKRTTLSALLTNWSSFKAVLESSGMKVIKTPYAATLHSLMYIGGSDLDIITPRTKSNYYVGEFWVKFRKTTPTRGS